MIQRSDGVGYFNPYTATFPSIIMLMINWMFRLDNLILFFTQFSVLLSLYEYKKFIRVPCTVALTELTAQDKVSTGVILQGCETNVSNVPDPNQGSDSSVRVTKGYTLHRQAANCKPGCPGAQVLYVYLPAFTSNVITL